MNLIEQFAVAKPGDLGIIGDPVEHSLSPNMHNPAFKSWWTQSGRDPGKAPAYHKFWVQPDQLKQAIELMRVRQLLGLNVTIPHKEAVCELLDIVDGFADVVHAVNTIRNLDGRLYGFNTDADGFEKSLTNDLKLNVTGKSVLVLGTGGTGAVLIKRLLDLRVSRLFYWNRSPHSTLPFEADLPRLARLHTSQEISHEIAKVDLIVNATSVGMNENDPLPIEGLKFEKKHFVFDVVYNRKTKFLEQARLAGAVVVDGTGMLLYQGARAFELWTGAPAPLEIMKKGLMKP